MQVKMGSFAEEEHHNSTSHSGHESPQIRVAGTSQLDLVKSQWSRLSRETHVKGGHITSLQSHLVAASGEFVGTFFFLWMSYSAGIMIVDQKSSTALTGGTSTETVVYVSLVYGFSLLVNAWAHYRISGGLFNPAVSQGISHQKDVEEMADFDYSLFDIIQVSVGLSVAGALPWTRTAFLIPAQLVASMVAGGLVKAMIPGDIHNANTTLTPGVSIVQGLFIEMFLTAQLVFVILMLAAEKSKVTFLAPIGIGLALFVSELSGKSKHSIKKREWKKRRKISVAPLLLLH